METKGGTGIALIMTNRPGMLASIILHLTCRYRFELSGQKIVGDGQLPGLGVQVFNLFFVKIRRFLAATFKDIRRALKRCPLPFMDNLRMHAEPIG